MEQPIATITYEGNFRTAIRHQNHVIYTDASKEYNGLEEALSPADLIPSAVASCLMTTLSMKAASKDLSLGEFYIEVTKELSEDFRVSSIELHCHLPKELTEKDRTSLERAGERYGVVSRSLDPAMKQTICYIYDL